VPPAKPSALFSNVAFADIGPTIVALENLWLIVVAVTLLLSRIHRQTSVKLNSELLEATT
jgi:hypothetical protein